MKNIRFIYVDSSGNTCIVWPMSQYIESCKANGVSEADIKQAIIEKDVLPYCPSGVYHEIDFEQDVPKDRYFRNAWEHDTVNGKLKVNRGKAEGIHMNKLRELRAAKLDKLDKDFMKALENNDKSAQNILAAKKQQLRDMPQTEDLSKLATLEELKAYIPEYLK